MSSSWLASRAVASPVAVIFLVLTLILAGGYAWLTLEVETFPAMSMPTVNIITGYPGASAADMEKLVTVPIESRIRGVADIKDVISVSREGQSLITVQFRETVHLPEAVQSLHTALNEVARSLPDEAVEPMVIPVGMQNLPVLILSLTGAADANQLKDIAERRLRPQLEKLPGVGSINIYGGTSPRFLVEADQEKLRSHGLTIRHLSSALQGGNLNMPAGEVRQGGGRYLARTVGSFETAADMGAVPVDIRRDPPVRVRDLARVVRDHYPVSGISRFNGHPYVQFQILKGPDANVVEVARRSLAELEKLKKDLPAGTEIRVLYDLSQFVEDQMSQVQFSALVGGFLAMAVLYLFLRRISATLIIGLSIPLSVLVTFMAMKFSDVSLNYMSLAGIILALGMLVDDSIVVLENIVRHREMGKDPVQAAADGAGEIASAVLASTITTVIVFAPVFLLSDWGPGVFLKSMAFTLVVAVSASYGVAMTVVPAFSALLAGRARLVSGVRSPRVQRFFRMYRSLLGHSLRHPIWTAVTVILMLVGSIWLGFRAGVDHQFNVGSHDVPVYFRFAPGMSLEAKEAAFARVEQAALSVAGVKNAYGWSDERKGEGTLMVSCGLHARREDTEQVKKQLRPVMEKIPGVHCSFQSFAAMTGGAPVDVSLRGRNWTETLVAADRLRDQLATIPGLVGVENMMRSEGRELHVEIDRERAAAFGVAEADIALCVRSALYGIVATRVVRDSREMDVLLRLPEEETGTVHGLPDLLIPSQRGGAVSLRDVARLNWRDSLPEITKKNGEPVVRVRADIEDMKAYGKILQAARKKTGAFIPPSGVDVEFGGQGAEGEEGNWKLLGIIGISMFLVYAVMAIQFNSFLQPLVIMVALPLSLIGCALGLWFFAVPVGMMAGVGVILLAGIVVNDAIVLVDYINQVRAAGASRLRALLDAGSVRLRPILMTSITTIFGVIPMALGIGHGSEVYVPLGVALIGGLSFATLLTLILIPVACNTGEASGEWLLKQINRFRK